MNAIHGMVPWTWRRVSLSDAVGGRRSSTVFPGLPNIAGSSSLLEAKEWCLSTVKPFASSIVGDTCASRESGNAFSSNPPDGFSPGEANKWQSVVDVNLSVELRTHIVLMNKKASSPYIKFRYQDVAL
jgi:hypothetical protein